MISFNQLRISLLEQKIYKIIDTQGVKGPEVLQELFKLEEEIRVLVRQQRRDILASEERTYIPTEQGIETGKRIIEEYKDALSELSKR